MNRSLPRSQRVFVLLIFLFIFGYIYYPSNFHPQASLYSTNGIDLSYEIPDHCDSHKAAGANEYQVFASPDGSDSSDGTYKKPLKSIQKAIKMAKKLQKNGKVSKKVVVYLREGVYETYSTISFGKSTSGEDEFARLEMRSYPKEIVRIVGGVTIPWWDFKEDPIMRNTYVINLKESGVTDYGELKPKGFGEPITPTQMEVFFDGKPLRLARYPNEDFMITGRVIERGSEYPYPPDPVKGSFKILNATQVQIDQWKREKDLWVFGYLGFDWADHTVSVGDIDGDVMNLGNPVMYGIKEHARYYLFNSLSELDYPGEYYIDREKHLLYIIPPHKPTTGSYVQLSIMDKPLVSFSDSSYVTLSCMTLEVSRGTGIQIIGGHHNSIERVTIRNVGNVGIIVGEGSTGHDVGWIGGSIRDLSYTDTVWNRNGGFLHRILNSAIYETGYGAIILGGGDRLTLEAGQNLVANTEMRRFGRVSSTYRPGIWMDGVGNGILHCHIHHGPHSAILYWGNDHTISYNDIHHLALETNDVGVIYTGRDFTSLGNKINFNYFHETSSEMSEGAGAQGVYLDDFASGTEVYGNIFFKVQRAIMIGGGKYNSFVNNLVINCYRVIVLDARGQVEKYAKHLEANGAVSTRYDAVPVGEGNWNKYTYLKTIWEKDANLPTGNVVKNNILYNSYATLQKSMKINELAAKIGDVQYNFIFDPLEPSAMDEGRNIKERIRILFQAVDSKLESEVPDFNKSIFIEGLSVGIEDKEM